MVSQAAAIQALWGATIALQVVLWAMLLATGLWRPYRRFTVYMVGLTVESGILYLVQHPAWLYQRVWIFTRLTLLILQLLAAVEIYSLWAEKHQNIGRFGHKLLVVLMGLAVGFSIATVPIAGSPRGWVLVVYVGLVANGAIQFGAGAFMLMMLGFFAKFGGPVNRNLRYHAGAMTAYSLANTIAYFLVARRIGSSSISVVLQVITAGALVFWIVTLRRSGETAPIVKIDPQAAADAEEENRQLLEFAETAKPQSEREMR